MKSWIKLSVAIFIFSALVPLQFIFAQSVPADFVKLFYYRDGKKAWESFQKNIKSIDVIAPQTYSVKADGEIKGGLTEDFLALAKKNNIKIMPLLTNSSFSQQDIHDILDNPNVQDKIIQAMIVEAQKEGYWGWQFDFEQMMAVYRDK